MNNKAIDLEVGYREEIDKLKDLIDTMGAELDDTEGRLNRVRR